jgi:hypothetical protein
MHVMASCLVAPMLLRRRSGLRLLDTGPCFTGLVTILQPGQCSCSICDSTVYVCCILTCLRTAMVAVSEGSCICMVSCQAWCEVREGIPIRLYCLVALRTVKFNVQPWCYC